MRRAKGWDDAEGLHPVQLVLTGELSVHDHGPTIDGPCAPVLPLRARHGLDHLFDGGVAVRVRQHLYAAREAVRDHAVHVFVGELGRAGVGR